MAALLSSLQISGLTGASATIATQSSISLWDDGSLRFTINGTAYRLDIGKDPAVAALVKKIFTGTGGITTANGIKVFGQP